MPNIHFFNRNTGNLEKEKVYKGSWLKLLYGDTFFVRIASFLVLRLFTQVPLFARLYGWFQKQSFTKRKVGPFIRDFGVDSTEFLETPESFNSFNDFFIRKLKKERRPLILDKKTAILPADARYLVYPSFEKTTLFTVKERICTLEELLKDDLLVERYHSGSLCMARLCPVDYHRFHFPVDCIPSAPRAIKGHLFSVNPIALKKNIKILSENKRVLTELETEEFGKILYIEVGATCVGTIHQTFTPHLPYQKGDEKGYFSFGGSCLLLLFERGKITFDPDLVSHSKEGREVLGKMGQSLGTKTEQIGQLST